MIGRWARATGMTAGVLKLGAWRFAIPAGVVLVFGTVILIGNGIAPYLFNGVTILGEIASQVRATTGLALTSRIPGRFDLLPRPHIVLHELHVADPSGTLSLDAEGLDGDVRLLPLIVGRIELASVTLKKPRLAIDLDARPMRPDSLIGRAMHAAPAAGREQRLGTVTLAGGTALIRSRALRRVPEIEDVNLTLDWPELESPATLAGSMSLRKSATDLAVWIGQPASLMRGDHSAVTVHLHSAPLDLSASGDLVSAATTGFRGRLTATAPSVLALLDLFDENTTLLAPFANVSLDSDAAIGIDPTGQAAIDLQSLKLRADGNAYEGTLALQSGEHPLLSGTLASEQLMLAPFLQRVPALTDSKRQWSRTPILRRQPQPLDLDLRVSATHLRLAPFTIDDAALSVMTRGDRTEVALVEGKVYGGVAKARFSAGLGYDDLNLRGTGSIAGADASALSWDVFGRQLVAGSLSGTVNLETSGDSPAALMSGLHGWAKGSIVNGELSGVDLGRALREVQRNKQQAIAGALRSGRTPFATLILDTRIVDGVATVNDGAIAGSDVALSLGGGADIGARSLEMSADAAPPKMPEAGVPPLQLRFDIGGSFDKPTVRPTVRALQAPAKP